MIIVNLSYQRVGMYRLPSLQNFRSLLTILYFLINYHSICITKIIILKLSKLELL